MQCFINIGKDMLNIDILQEFSKWFENRNSFLQFYSTYLINENSAVNQNFGSNTTSFILSYILYDILSHIIFLFG